MRGGGWKANRARGCGSAGSGLGAVINGLQRERPVRSEPFRSPQRQPPPTGFVRVLQATPGRLTCRRSTGSETICLVIDPLLTNLPCMFAEKPASDTSAASFALTRANSGLPSTTPQARPRAVPRTTSEGATSDRPCSQVRRPTGLRGWPAAPPVQTGGGGVSGFAGPRAAGFDRRRRPRRGPRWLAAQRYTWRKEGAAPSTYEGGARRIVGTSVRPNIAPLARSGQGRR